MTNKFIFATINKNKIEEVSEIAAGKYKIISPADLGYSNELPETQPTLEGNALQKARFIYDRFGINSFADDTGLEVDALNGEPGVYSARYAGENKSPEENIKKLLSKIADCPNNNARFRTVVVLILEDKEYFFEGKIEGQLIDEPRGTNGFGYDPIFVPEGFDLTFAELPVRIKNKISHRAIAFEKLFHFLNNYKEL
jgi:XTP/dITP diphosphohydrolase